MREHLERRVAALTQLRVDDPAAPVLSAEADHHLRKVLRAKLGEEIVVTNGRGAWAFATVGEIGLTSVSEVSHDPAPDELALYVAPLKGDKSEWVVAKAVELGVTRLVPLVSDRVTVTTKQAAMNKMLARWRRIAMEATGQCRRTHDMDIKEPIRVRDVPSHVAIADVGGGDPVDDIRAIAIGPEGGWSKDEWDPARRRVGLGEGVLRAETAAIVAATLLASGGDGWSRRTDTGAKR